ncbi:MAG: UvrD-helicase domain-containing protein, partial [Pseudomonadota bacterium]
LQQVKAQRNVQSFDDLLWNVHAALQGEAGEKLAERLRKRYSAALIDEFQDTDSLQYEIFQRIYPVELKSRLLLFLIGDPKQAIYSFRGADVFTYITAASDAEDARHTLGVNWRSTPEFINAVNTVFDGDERMPDPFILPQIGFRPATSAGQVATPDWATESAPLQLWYLGRNQVDERYLGDPEKKSRVISKPHAEQLIVGAVATEIVRLLELPDGPAPGDIAVLVRKNQQALEMGRALRSRRVPSVVYSRDSLFNSAETSEMRRVLQAVAFPNVERNIRSAVTTDMLGVTGDGLQHLLRHDSDWEDWILRFRDYHERWQRDGFMPMFQSLMVTEKVPQRLLRYADGERRLTNVLHLAEVLQTTAVQLRRSMSTLLKWLADQQSSDNGDDEYQIRLESDENAVKLVTIHRSKGLEYPVVFVPFAWDGAIRSSSKHEGVVFHDETDNALNLDLGSTELNTRKSRSEEETRSEDLRLLYVAITRAQYRCYLTWGPINGATKSSLIHLLHPAMEKGKKAIKLGETGDETLRAELQTIAGQSDGTIEITDLPKSSRKPWHSQAYDMPEQTRLRTVKQALTVDWSVSSFTSMTQSAGHHNSWLAEQPDRDAWTQTPALNADADDPIFALPPGLETGNLLHDILDSYDFQVAPEESSIITNRLRNHGGKSLPPETVHELLNNLRKTSLDANNPALRLENVNRQARLNEMEFYYPVSQLQAQQFTVHLKQMGLYRE